jgi:RNA-dependent RNA polymerase
MEETKLRLLREGIDFRATHYKFCGHSNSGLNDSTCYFMPVKSKGEAGLQEVFDLWNKLGDFKEILKTQNREKVISRIGMAFARSIPIDISRFKCGIMNDIPSKEKGKVFTDGIGKMREKVANHFAEELGLNYVPSAFQFRFKGMKGILVISNEIQRGVDIIFTKSQEKFKSTISDFEILSWSKGSQGKLSQQVISILSSGGVPDEVFVKLAKETIEEVKDETDVVRIVNEFKTGNYAEKIKGLVLSGHTSMTNHLLADLYYERKSRRLADLMVKHHLKLEKSRTCIGSLDFSRTLKENEIFFYCNDPLVQIEDGMEVLVTRYPAYHIGDIRKLIVRTIIPTLKQCQSDLLVFPLVGDRPIPDQMGGGDLDGDMFLLIWEPEIVKNFRESPPQKYGSPPGELKYGSYFF